MIKKLFEFWRKKKSAKPQAEKNQPSAPNPQQGSPYSDEEAEKVKERLQGLGYID